MDEKKVEKYLSVGDAVHLFMGLYVILICMNPVAIIISALMSFELNNDIILLMMLICSVVATVVNVFEIIILKQKEFNNKIFERGKKHAKMTMIICLVFVAIPIIFFVC